MPQDLPLEPDLIKVLASDSRRDILRYLRDRNMTVTELARELGLGKATVHEHLNKLQAAGLIERQEDDRLWVYYRLTGEGKRMLNPQRTRFYLIVGLGAFAAIAGVLAVALFLSTAGGPELAASPEGGVAVQPANDRIYAAQGAQFDALLEGAEADQVRAYLLTPEQAQALEAGRLDVQGLPLSIHPAPETATSAVQESRSADAAETSDGADVSADRMGPDRITLRATATLSPGTYHLLVVGPDGDNRQALPVVVVEGLTADASHDTWYAGLSSDLRVWVNRSQTPAEGTIMLAPLTTPEGPALTLALKDGRAQLPAASLDTLHSGRYALRVLPIGADGFQDTGTRVTLVHPAVSLAPNPVPAHGAAQVWIGTWPRQALTGTNASVLINGTDLLDSRPAEGRLLLELGPRPPGTVDLQLGRLDPVQLRVTPETAVHVAVHEDSRWELTVRNATGPVEGAAIRLDGAEIGTTNATGGLTLDAPAEGEHALTVEPPGEPPQRRLLRVEGWMPTALEPEVQVSPVEVDTTTGQARVTARVTHDAEGTVHAVLEGHLDGSLALTRTLTIAPNGSSLVELNLPVEPGADHQLRLTARATGLPALTATNETAPADDREPGSPGDGDAGEPPADDAPEERTALVAREEARGATIVLHVPGTPEAMVGADAPAAAEPVYGEVEGAAADEPAATPLPVALALGAVVVAGLLGARRRRR